MSVSPNSTEAVDEESEEDFEALLCLLGYQVDKLLEKGGFGMVYQCIRPDTDEQVAVKAIQSYDSYIGREELANLERIQDLDPDRNNFIKFNRYFEVDGHIFLEFEKLDWTIDDLVLSDGALLLSDIQVITQQMLVAMNALKSIGLIHGDIKPNNIMLVNHKQKPFQVKLIDFGISCLVSNLRGGEMLHIPEYQAPEISLGLPLNEASDMWALGCVVAFMYLAKDLYSGTCELGKMEEIVQWHGQPADHLIESGLYVLNYFEKVDSPSFTLRTTCICAHGEYDPHEPIRGELSRQFSSLDDIVKTRPGTAEQKDTQTFVSLLKEMLNVNPFQRITPRDALRHPFMTWNHFPSDAIYEKVKPLPKDIPNYVSNCDTAAADRGVASPVECTSHGSAEDNIGETDEKAGLAEVKTKKKYYKRLCTFLSGLLKKGTCTNNFDSYTEKKPSPIVSFKRMLNIGSPDIPATFATHVSDEDNMASDEETTGLAEVKTKKKYYKRVCTFLSGLFRKESSNKSLNDSSTDEPPTDGPADNGVPDVCDGGKAQAQSDSDDAAAGTLDASAAHTSAEECIVAEEDDVKTKKSFFEGICGFFSQFFKKRTSTNEKEPPTASLKTTSDHGFPDDSDSGKVSLDSDSAAKTLAASASPGPAEECTGTQENTGFTHAKTKKNYFQCNCNFFSCLFKGPASKSSTEIFHDSSTNEKAPPTGLSVADSPAGDRDEAFSCDDTSAKTLAASASPGSAEQCINAEENPGFTDAKTKKSCFKWNCRFFSFLFKENKRSDGSSTGEKSPPTASMNDISTNPFPAVADLPPAEGNEACREVDIAAETLPARHVSAEECVGTEENSGFTDVKTKKSRFKSICGFFSGLIKKRTPAKNFNDTRGFPTADGDEACPEVHTAAETSPASHVSAEDNS